MIPFQMPSKSVLVRQSSASEGCIGIRKSTVRLHSHSAEELRTGSVTQDAVELLARLDVELGEDFLQVILHGAGADEQPRADLGVGVPVAGHPGDRLLEQIPGDGPS
jgi:hypothetical protein